MWGTLDIHKPSYDRYTYMLRMILLLYSRDLPFSDYFASPRRAEQLPSDWIGYSSSPASITSSGTSGFFFHNKAMSRVGTIRQQGEGRWDGTSLLARDSPVFWTHPHRYVPSETNDVASNIEYDDDDDDDWH